MRTLEFIRKYLDRAHAEGRLHDLALREKDAAVVAELARLDALDTRNRERQSERDAATARAWREKVEPRMSPAFIRRGSFADHADEFPDCEGECRGEPTNPAPAAALLKQDDPNTPAYLRAALREVERMSQ
jgi:hypothetical protein